MGYSVIIGLVVLAISFPKDERLHEVRFHDIKGIIIIVGIMSFEEDNLSLPCCCLRCVLEMADSLELAITFHITRRSFMECPVSRNTIHQGLGESF